MESTPTDARPRRVWILSPALATAIFFAVQVVLSVLGGQPQTGMAGLAPRTPQAPRGGRVAQPIEPADPVLRSLPEDGEALMRLLDRHRRLRFRGAAGNH